MPNFNPSLTHIPNIIKVEQTVHEKCSGQKNMDGGRCTAHAARRTDIWITKSLPEQSSGETKRLNTAAILKFKMAAEKMELRYW